MSADRTLMSVVRTSLSLIGFGFTNYQFFPRMQQAEVLRGGTHAARSFGLALILLGVGMLALGILYHVEFVRELPKSATGKVLKRVLRSRPA